MEIHQTLSVRAEHGLSGLPLRPVWDSTPSF
jgi:hypothetical protein